MKRILLCSLFFISTQLLSAQVFTESPQSPPFVQVTYSSVAFADVNGDNHQDVFISGTNQTVPYSKLYLNDGTGFFTEATGTPFVNVSHGSIVFKDVNGDNYQDVFVTGRDENNEGIAKLYINDGLGNFTEMAGTPFIEVRSSSADFADVNGDSFPDLLLTGQKPGVGFLAALYINDGNGNFTEMTDTPFEAVNNGSVDFADVNGDGYPDVLISGSSFFAFVAPNLYFNDGAGNFTLVTGVPFIGVSNSSVAFADVNGDNFLDVLISGQSGNNSYSTELYLNDGTGIFTLVPNTPFGNIGAGQVAFADVNGNGYMDAMLTGATEGSEEIAKLFINDGLGNFTELIGTSFTGVDTDGLAFADVNGDGHQDVMISGANDLTPTTKLYLNDGTVNTNDLKFISNLIFTSFPNPLTGNTLYVDYTSIENDFLTLKIYDINGQLLKEQKEFAKIGDQVFSISVGSLASGTYFIELDDGIRKKVSKFLVD
jgi:hypothetical protein